MAVAWMIVPYKPRQTRAPGGIRIGRYCAIDDYTPQLTGWRETRVAGNHAIVLATGDAKVLSDIAANEASYFSFPVDLRMTQRTAGLSVREKLDLRSKILELGLKQADIDRTGISLSDTPLLGVFEFIATLPRSDDGREVMDKVWSVAGGAGPLARDPRTGIKVIGYTKSGLPIFPIMGGAFPTTSIIDDFNRANGAIGGSWSVLGGTVNISSNQITGTTGGDFALYNTTYGPDVEVYMTMAVKTGADGFGWNFPFRWTNATSTGYYVEMTRLAGTDSIGVWEGPAFTQLGATISQEEANGDAFGVSMIGSTIDVQYKASGGSWTSLGTRSDSTVTGSGNVGFYISDTTLRLDDYGAGTVSAAATSRPLFPARMPAAILAR